MDDDLISQLLIYALLSWFALIIVCIYRIPLWHILKYYWTGRGPNVCLMLRFANYLHKLIISQD